MYHINIDLYINKKYWETDKLRSEISIFGTIFSCKNASGKSIVFGLNKSE